MTSPTIAYSADVASTDPTSTSGSAAAAAPATHERAPLRSPGATFQAYSRAKSANPGNATYERRAGGILFRDADRTPFAFLVANRHGERFFVSCHLTAHGLRYLFSTCADDERRLGIATLGYGERQRLAASWWNQVVAPTVAPTISGD